MRGRICTTCDEFKSLEAFKKDSRKKDGRGAICKECASSYSCKWQASNREKHNRTSLAYFYRHPDKASVARKNWKKANPEKVKHYDFKRRALKQETSIEVIDFRVIYSRDGGKCWICEKSVSYSKTSWDHVVPLSKGGPHTVGNLRPTHYQCNVSKGVKLLAVKPYLGETQV